MSWRPSERQTPPIPPGPVDTRGPMEVPDERTMPDEDVFTTWPAALDLDGRDDLPLDLGADLVRTHSGRDLIRLDGRLELLAGEVRTGGRQRVVGRRHRRALLNRREIGPGLAERGTGRTDRPEARQCGRGRNGSARVDSVLELGDLAPKPVELGVRFAAAGWMRARHDAVDRGLGVGFVPDEIGDRAVVLRRPARPGAAPVVDYIHTDQIGSPAEDHGRVGGAGVGRRVRPLRQPDRHHDSDHPADELGCGRRGAASAGAGPSLSANPLRLPGQYHDPETQTSCNWMRTYDPSIGRYIQADPFADIRPAAISGATAPGMSPVSGGAVTAMINLAGLPLSSQLGLLIGLAGLQATPHGAFGIATDSAANDNAARAPSNGLSLYGYAKQSPLTRTDPRGLFPSGPMTNISRLGEQSPQQCQAGFATLLGSVRDAKSARNICYYDIGTGTVIVRMARPWPEGLLIDGPAISEGQLVPNDNYRR